ncbi:MAG: hypothetical protein OJF59_000008 [Cytophagales bacterium]|jgi:hypothetical protein|nr:DUF2911 domain-containing protein [Bacteroidota bacterium]MBS1982477.1 DUF2911 domain-containing protein [Bacteroidota bacterium]WHZ06256.1 MAG: hypothetical protein OJF59_000008 [Cytophagales bacterium]
MKFFVISLALFSTVSLPAQKLSPRLSPLAVVSARYKNAYLKIVYSQPQKNGREIFGKLVPYGQVWRLGANEATEMTCTHDISVSGNTLKAGTYSLFAIPEKEKWTLIINGDQGLWGSYNYNPKTDVVRIDLPVSTLPNGTVCEPFTIKINQKTDTAEIVIMWDQTQVNLPVHFIDPKP